MVEQDGQFTIQDVPLEALAAQYGTPVYVYDGGKIAAQLRSLQSAFSNCNFRVNYAMKALSNLAILKLLKKLGACVDAVSINEVRLALKAGFAPEEVLFTPSCVDIDEISEGVSLGVSVTVDSLSLLEAYGKAHGAEYPCCIRLNPHIQAGGNPKISTGHGEAKFGISVFQLPQLLQIINEHNIQVNGLHMHTGSEITDTDVYLKMARLLFDIARDFPVLEFLDFGGGFKIIYKEGDYATNMFDLGLNLGNMFNEFCGSYGRKLALWAEPGKFLVSEAGYLLVRTTVVKPTPSITFVGVDSGLNHLIRPMMYDAWHDIVNISNPGGKQKTYSVVGNVCETDTFGTDRRLTAVRKGDLLVIQNAGAYGYSMASNYNGRFRPAEVLIENGEARLIRKRDTLEDLLRGQV